MVLGQVEQPVAEVEAGLLPVGEALVTERLDLRRSWAAPRGATPWSDGQRSPPRPPGRRGFHRVLGWGWGLGHMQGCRRDPTSRRYDPVRCRSRCPPHPFPAAYQFGPKPKRRTELGLLIFVSILIVALYVIAVLGQKSKIPANIGPFLGSGARAGTDRPHGQPLARPQCQRGDPAAGRPAERHRLRRHRPVEPRTGPGPGRLGRLRRAPLLPHAARRPLLARPRALSLPAAAGRRRPPGRPAVLLADQRRAPVGPPRQPVVPAGRVLQDPAVHLLRLVLRREQGAALHPDGPDRQPALPRPRPLLPILVAWGAAMADHRAGGRHRLRRPLVRPVHRAALGGHGPGGLPGARAGPLRGWRRHRRPLLRPGPPAGRAVAQPLAHRRPSG